MSGPRCCEQAINSCCRRREGRFEVVVAEALDRLSRDQESVAALYKRLSFGGIRSATLAEGEISELHVGLEGTMNGLFLKDLAQKKTRRGLRAGSKPVGPPAVTATAMAW
jgi:DNA invertase Pin-like site-specific DNA recombinase